MSRHFRLLLVLASLWLLTGPPVSAQPPAAKGTAGQGKAPARVDLFGDPLPPGALARLGTLRFRLSGPVRDAALSADGTRVAVTNYSAVRGGRRISLLDVRSGKQLHHPPFLSK